MQQAPLRVHEAFPRLTRRDPLVPVWNVTPGRGGCIVRFFDTPALSPSGRFVACFRLPFENRLPRPGERGEVVLVDLHEGPDAERVVASTAGWEPQLGAQVNWGGDDDTLLFSDVDTETWTPHAVRLDLRGGGSARLDGPIYHASPDGRFVVGGNPRLMPRTQRGYGVVLPEDQIPTRRGAPEDDGVWITDAHTGASRLLVSLAEVVRRFGSQIDVPRPDDREVYVFHTKFAPTGDRVLFTIRHVRAGYEGPPEPISGVAESDLKFAIFTCGLDGSRLALALGPDAWRHGGHHINFAPDGTTLSMNLGGLTGDGGDPRGLRFARVPATGGEVRPLLANVSGSGHPTLHPDGRHLLSDCYWGERWRDESDGTTPLRWIDLRDGGEREVCRVVNRPPHDGPGLPATLRVDPHPCWDRTWRFVTFTGVEGNTRRVFLADMRPLL